MGKGVFQIAKALSAKRLVSPVAYKYYQGDARFARYVVGKKNDYTWCYYTIQMILKDRVYIGDMVNCKFEVVNYKTKNYRTVPEDRRIVIENTHVPIIDKDTFN